MTSPRKRIALVTEELSIFPPSGGIGAAFQELALSLSAQGHGVDVLFVPTTMEMAEAAREGHYALSGAGVRLIVPDFDKYVWDGNDYSKKTYTVFKTLEEIGYDYDFIHFHEYKGLGFATIEAKRCGLAFADTDIVVQLHGPTAWTMAANRALFSHPDQLRIDHMERRCIAAADVVVSPSRFLLDWMVAEGFRLPPDGRRKVIKNVMNPARCPGSTAAGGRVQPNEIIMFGRHEGRKGPLLFVDAIRKLSREGLLNGVGVTFLGGFGEINGRHSGLVLTEMLKGEDIMPSFITGAGREAAHDYLLSRPDALVVVPSPEENLPYTVFEAASLGKPVLSSERGGGREIIAEGQHGTHLFTPDVDGLVAAITAALANGIAPSVLSESKAEVEAQWAAFHATRHAPKREGPAELPRVTLGITHYERPRKLMDALWSAIRQDYDNLEIIVVDDGSRSPESREALDRVEQILQRCGGRLIRQENAYLGAARNTVARHSASDYLVFLDDDDIAFPDMVSCMVTAAVHSGAEVINCPNLFMEEARRPQALIEGEDFDQKLSYFPLGGPLSVCTRENWFGSATALIRRDVYDRLGGYTEERGVGFEDYEFMFRVVQSGAEIAILPRPLYLYEVDRPSMISRTSMVANYRRVFNAIDPALCGEALRDLLGVTIGRKALDDQASRLRYEEERDPHAELLGEVRKAATPEDRRAALAAYAQAIGAEQVARAWRADPLVDTPAVPLRKTPAPRRNRPAPAAQGGAFADITVLLAHGRTEDAAALLLRHARATFVVPEDMVLAFAHLCRAVPEGKEPLITRTALTLLDSEMELEGAAVVLAELLHFTVSRGVEVPELRGYLADIYGAEETAYCSRYPEVHQAIHVKGILPDGMEHYKRHGHAERREGFELFDLTAAKLSRRHGNMAAWDLPRLLGFATFRDLAGAEDRAAPARKTA